MNMGAYRFLFSRFVFCFVVAGLAIYYTFFYEKLRFGIDLVGGSYITLEVQTNKAIETELSEQLKRIPDRLKKANIKLSSKELINNEIILKFETPDAAQVSASILRDENQLLKVTTEGSVVKARFKEKEAEKIAQDAVQTDIEVLRNRIDKFGVAESSIAVQGDKNIIVELPAMGTEEAKAAIGKAAKLEFRLVEKVSGSKEDLLYEYDGDLPEDKEILPGRIKAELGGPEAYYLVDRFTDLTGKLLRKAAPTTDMRKMAPAVSLTFNPTGSQRFFDLTRKNPGKLLAIVLDNVVIDAPRIEGPIPGGEASISPMPSPSAAKELAVLLKSGAYVAPVTVEEEREIGPGLGKESINQGLIACLLGLGLLFVFALFYYSYSGLFAFMALIYNLILVLFGLCWFRATLTLPGIAGMVLTVGMAIDASILIFEKIKEELAAELSLKKAVDAGFKDVLVVILDANLTTFIVGAVLYWVGTGPIKGFAVTLMLGIAATLVSGLFFLRALFNFVIDTFNIQTLRI